MSFRCRQKFIPSPSCDISDLEDCEQPSGQIDTRLVSQSQKVMPNPVLFDIKNQMESGLNLDVVNSKVLSSKNVSAEQIVRKYVKHTDKPSNNEDKVNEN